MSQVDQGTKLPHCWYEDSGVIYKWYYCPVHQPETRDNTFKTKKELIANQVTRRLLNEKDSDVPF